MIISTLSETLRSQTPLAPWLGFYPANQGDFEIQSQISISSSWTCVILLSVKGISNFPTEISQFFISFLVVSHIRWNSQTNTRGAPPLRRIFTMIWFPNQRMRTFTELHSITNTGNITAAAPRSNTWDQVDPQIQRNQVKHNKVAATVLILSGFWSRLKSRAGTWLDALDDRMHQWVLFLSLRFFSSFWPSWPLSRDVGKLNEVSMCEYHSARNSQ